ncbi:MAG: hypothetical protein ISP91_10340 [Pseudomonadales bacterium]|jgi:hypothetical protein|nr:hypothetical protein [Pseudomonadales bacterium]
MRLFTIFTFMLFLCACTDPVIGVPGGKLKGEEIKAPDSWSSVPDVVQLEMRPDDPYSINIWAAVANDTLYIATLDAKWLNFIREDNRVRVRMDRKIYRLAASEVTGEEEKLAVGEAYTDKYDYEMSPEDLTVANVFRLTPR